jgi:hypothetical protein
MSNKILVKQSGPTVFQNVGPTGTRPSFMDMARTTFAPRGQVGVGQRLRGLAGMAGKGAAAAVTAQQTAERMQAGDASAPLQAGITYQGIDPTGTINPNIGEQMYKPGQPQVLPTPPNPPNPTGMQPNTTGQRPGTVGVAPNNSTFTSPIDMSQYPSVANPSGMAQHQGNHPVLMPATQTQATASTLPQTVQNQVANMGGALAQQNNQFDPNQYIDKTQQFHHNAVTQELPGQQMGNVLAQQGAKTAAFVGTLFDKLGPDMVYKMTPHEIGAVSALMYLKLS